MIFIFIDVLFPIVTFLHNIGLIEIFLYLFAFQIIVEGTRMEIRESMSLMITLTGIVITWGLCTYST